MTTNNLIYVVFIMGYIIFVLIMKYRDLSNRNKVLYNNYMQCLRALSDTDSSLAKYLKERGDIQ